MTRSRLLIVDDELIVREDLRDLLEGLGYEVVGTAVAGSEAVTKARDLRPDLVLMDIKLKDQSDGIDAATTIYERFALPVVFITAFADEATIARAAAAHPYGYLTKPFNDRAIRATIEVALHRRREEKEAVRLVVEPSGIDPPPGGSFHGLIGNTPAMRELFQQITRAAHVNTTLLIEGETGTGKERVARALHQAGSRASKPFIAVNCAGLTETLTASELFGHRRGAFTGAVSDHKGMFEAANGGTLLLDEIGDIPRNQQPFLLRALEEREITRVGESTPRRFDVRVLAASNRSLDEAVASGQFRSDLLFRIRIARIVVPPLRDRGEDIALLARRFLAMLPQEGRPAADLSADTLAMLASYRWPGNVRELKNAIEYAAIRASGHIITPIDLPPEIEAMSRPPGGPGMSPDEERMRLFTALRIARDNRTEAARLLGISRATLYRKLSEAGVATREEGAADSVSRHTGGRLLRHRVRPPS